MALAGPVDEGGRESVLEGVLGDIEIAEGADEGRERSGMMFAKDRIDGSGGRGIGGQIGGRSGQTIHVVVCLRIRR